LARDPRRARQLVPSVTVGRVPHIGLVAAAIVADPGHYEKLAVEDRQIVITPRVPAVTGDFASVILRRGTIIVPLCGL
jgi:hypothetical protein